MDMKQRDADVGLLPSLKFLTQQLTSLTTAEEKSWLVIYQQIEERAKLILIQLDQSEEGKQLAQQKPEEFKGIRKFVMDVRKLQGQQTKLKYERMALGGAGGGIVSGGLAAASNMGSGKAGAGAGASPRFGSSAGGQQPASSGWGWGSYALLGAGLFAGTLIATHYFGVLITVKVEGGRLRGNIKKSDDPGIDADIVALLGLLGTATAAVMTIQAQLAGGSASTVSNLPASGAS